MAKPVLDEHIINTLWCKGCGICVHFCPKDVLELDDRSKVFAARPQDCICCRMCEHLCPDLAIEVRIKENKIQDREDASVLTPKKSGD
jgi:2-oxoglutarate ferredoxin oxidoreductase subunit delta